MLGYIPHIYRYKSLGDREKQLLEDDEDNLLGILLHNMAAFMLCMGVDKKLIKSKVRRLLAKSHIGLTQTQSVDNLLDVILDMVNKLFYDLTIFFLLGNCWNHEFILHVKTYKLVSAIPLTNFREFAEYDGKVKKIEV